MAGHWNPLQDLISLQERMNELFEESVGRGSRQNSAGTANWTPAVDIFETPSEVVLKADLPGLNQQDIHVKVEDRQLIMRGERSSDTEAPSECYHRTERPAGIFHRSFNLPPTVDETAIRAAYRDGVLRVVLPKREATGPRPITINVE